MTAREEVICQVLARWADELDLPVTVRQLAGLAVEVDRELRWQEPHLRPRVAGSKPRSTPDDARLIAARLEASFRGGAR